jgi:hypothetical protein
LGIRLFSYAGSAVGADEQTAATCDPPFQSFRGGCRYLEKGRAAGRI